MSPGEAHRAARGELCQPGRHRLGCPHETGDAPYLVTPELAEDGSADPDRAWAWRDCGTGAEDTDDDPDGYDPCDGAIDTEASWAAFEAWTAAWTAVKERRG